MRSRGVFAAIFLVVVFAAVLVLGWRKDGPNTFQAAFQPGGNVSMDLSVGGYEIRGTTDSEIRVEVSPSDLPSTHSEIKVNGNHASVRVEGRPNNFHAVIYVPQQTNITADQTIGQLRIVDVEGDKYVGLNIGQILIDLPETEKLKSVDASVTIGALRANPWHTQTGGFFRSFEASGKGNYKVSARLNIGDLELR